MVAQITDLKSTFDSIGEFINDFNMISNKPMNLVSKTSSSLFAHHHLRFSSITFSSIAVAWRESCDNRLDMHSWYEHGCE
eukprot:760925-Hanusia_phi.AAC.1